MSIYPEILTGRAVVADLLADYDTVHVLIPGDRAGAASYYVACMVMQHGVNVCAYGKWGFEIDSWGQRGYQLVEWPVSPLVDDYAGFQRVTAEALLPVVDSALAAVADQRAVSRSRS